MCSEGGPPPRTLPPLVEVLLDADVEEVLETVGLLVVLDIVRP